VCWFRFGNKNSSKTVIKTYFDSVDQGVLYCLLQKEIECVDTLALLKQILDGYRSKIVFDNGNLFEARKVGIPIGNLTSQLFANIYLKKRRKYVREVIDKKYLLMNMKKLWRLGGE
jgi:hypothetical protein